MLLLCLIFEYKRHSNTSSRQYHHTHHTHYSLPSPSFFYFLKPLPTMHSLSTITTALALLSGASSFVIHTFSDTNCQNFIEEVNVWDNTCATWPQAFSSFVPTVYGGAHQMAYFFTPDNCGDLITCLGGAGNWADGGDSGFQVNQCHSWGEGHQASAAASYAD